MTASCTIVNIKANTQIKTDIPPIQQRLMVADKQLEDDHGIADYKVQKASTLHLMCAWRWWLVATKNSSARGQIHFDGIPSAP